MTTPPEPHRVTFDEDGCGGDPKCVTYCAFCEGCNWHSTRFHSGEGCGDFWGYADPAQAALEAASAQGQDHLAYMELSGEQIAG